MVYNTSSERRNICIVSRNVLSFLQSQEMEYGPGSRTLPHEELQHVLWTILRVHWRKREVRWIPQTVFEGECCEGAC